MLVPQLLVALTTAAEEDVAIPSTVEDEVDADDPPPPPQPLIQIAGKTKTNKNH
jgi:hypothetical protein